MGFDQNTRRKVFELPFRATYPGLLVRCRKPAFGALEQLYGTVLVLGEDLDGRGLSVPVRLAAWRDLFEAFADSMISWNLSDRGRDVPATKKGVLAQDQEFLLTVARTWYRLVVLHSEDVAAPEPAQVVDRSTEDVDEPSIEDRLVDIPVTVRTPVEDDTDDVADVA